MFGKSIKLFTLFGFTVRLDLSWIIILALVVWSLSAGVFPQLYEGLPPWVYWAMGFAGALGLFVSIIFHEMCHSLVARRYGLPMKGITLFLFGGVAEMSDEPPSPKAEFWMAIAGPASSAALAGAFFLIGYGGGALGLTDSIAGVFRWLGLINIILVVFNMIPGFPLDGGRVLRAILWHYRKDLRSATQTASRVGAGFGAVLIGLGFLSLLWGNPLGGLWWILIGFFIRSAAKSGYRQVLVREMLHGEPVRRFMTEQPITVPSSATLTSLVDDYVYRYHHKLFPVTTDGRLDGYISTQDLQDVPKDQWDERTVREVARPCQRDNTIAPDADAMDALARMNKLQTSRLMVVENNALVGIVALKDLMKFLSLKLELETNEHPPIEPRQAA